MRFVCIDSNQMYTIIVIFDVIIWRLNVKHGIAIIAKYLYEYKNILS